jgi:cholesterol transport system auxiliary component
MTGNSADENGGRQIMKFGYVNRMTGLLAAIWLLGACSILNRPEPATKNAYLLQGTQTAESTVTAATARHCLELRVSPPAAAPGFTTSGMMYVTEPPRLDYFARNEWVDTPARMLGAMIESRLDTAGLFGAIVSGATDIRTDLRLDTQLLRLAQEFEGDGSRVVLVVKVTVIDVTKRASLGSRTFSYAEPAPAANPEAGAQAANRAADRFMDDLLLFLQNTNRSLTCPPPG